MRSRDGSAGKIVEDDRRKQQRDVPCVPPRIEEQGSQGEPSGTPREPNAPKQKVPGQGSGQEQQEERIRVEEHLRLKAFLPANSCGGMLAGWIAGTEYIEARSAVWV